MRRLVVLLLGTVLAGTSIAAETPYRIGYLERTDDPAYHPARLDARYPGHPAGRPFAAAEVALKEIRYTLGDLDRKGVLDRRSADSRDDLVRAARSLVAEGASFLLVDAAADDIVAVSRAVAELPVAVLNIRSADERLRGAQCQPRLLHLMPSERQFNDAISQWLRTRNWRDVWLLHGTSEADRQAAASVKASLRRLGLRVVAEKPFVLGNDPREREQNNVGLLTAGRDHDVVWVVDTDGEFARRVPFATQRPRPVVGSAGLQAMAWHWVFDRHGAPQLTRRLQRGLGRDPGSADWAAWMAVKAIGAAVAKAGTVDFPPVFAALTDETLVLDGFKGFRMGFRPWDGQLRQPMMIGSSEQVLAMAPLEGFLHATNTLDTLGSDARESACQRRQ